MGGPSRVPRLPVTLGGLSQINKLHLCKPLIRAIDSSNLKDDYSTAQRVTFRYYVGRKAMFDSDFKQGLFVFAPRAPSRGALGGRHHHAP